MGILGIVLLLAGCLIAGALGYVVACRCDKRAVQRDVYREQVKAAAKKIGEETVLALIEEEIQCPADAKPDTFHVPDPKHWRLGTLRYSRYAIIPVPVISLLPKPKQERLRRILLEIENTWPTPENPYVVTMRENGGKRHYIKDPLLAA